MAATATLVREGMKIVTALVKDRREIRREMREWRDQWHREMQALREAQARTEATLERYLKSLSNGHNSRTNGDSKGKK